MSRRRVGETSASHNHPTKVPGPGPRPGSRSPAPDHASPDHRVDHQLHWTMAPRRTGSYSAPMLLLAFRTRCPSRIRPYGHGLLRSHRPGPAAGCRARTGSRTAAATSRILRLEATVHRLTERSAFQSIAPGVSPESRGNVCFPQPPNEGTRPRTPSRQPVAGPGPRKPCPSGRPPATLDDGAPLCRKPLSPDAPPGLPDALSQSGRPEWSQTPA